MKFPMGNVHDRLNTRWCWNCRSWILQSAMASWLVGDEMERNGRRRIRLGIFTPDLRDLTGTSWLAEEMQRGTSWLVGLGKAGSWVFGGTQNRTINWTVTFSPWQPWGHTGAGACRPTTTRATRRGEQRASMTRKAPGGGSIFRLLVGFMFPSTRKSVKPIMAKGERKEAGRTLRFGQPIILAVPVNWVNLACQLTNPEC